LKKEKTHSPHSGITKCILSQNKNVNKKNAIYNSNKYDKNREQSEN